MQVRGTEGPSSEESVPRNAVAALQVPKTLSLAEEDPGDEKEDSLNAAAEKVRIFQESQRQVHDVCLDVGPVSC